MIPVFNFFEPLHYFQHNEGFQTWELSPQFAIRSWSYLLLHWPFAGIVPRILKMGKVSRATLQCELKDPANAIVEAAILRDTAVPRPDIDSM